MHIHNFFYSTIHTRHVIKVSKLQKYNFQEKEEVSFPMFLEKMTLNHLEKKRFGVIIIMKKKLL